MDGTVTWPVVGLIVTVAGGAVGLWWIIEARIADVRSEFLAFKEKVLQDYASISHLEKVENKLISAIKELTHEVKELTRIIYNKVKDDGSTS
jgi:hypothetical protein